MDPIGSNNQSMSNEGVCRTAPATPGLLNINLHVAAKKTY